MIREMISVTISICRMKDQVWIDYFTGEQYQGGRVINGFDAPVWKTPVFVKNGAIIPMSKENNSPAGG